MEIERQAAKLALLPFYEPSGSIGGVRGPDGCGFYFPDGAKPTPSLVYAFTDGEVWAINTLYLSLVPGLIHLEEEKLVKSLDQCIDFLKGLGIPGPYRWVAGLEGVHDRCLRVDHFGRKIGLCQESVIEFVGSYKTGEKSQQVLETFFEEVFDKCGLTRPAIAPIT